MSEIVKWVAAVGVLVLVGWVLQIAERRAKNRSEFVRIRALVILALFVLLAIIAVVYETAGTR